RVQERRRLRAERPLYGGVIGRVDERDVGSALPGPTFEQRARLPVAVLLCDDAPTVRDRARVHERRDGGHPGDEARDGLDTIELRERRFERGDRRRAVAAIHVAGPLVAEDGILLCGPALIEGEAMDEGGDER